MRLTPALYVRQLLAKLSPPFRRTAQESQKLINVLNTSFRKQLDETHPSPSQGAETDDALHQTIPLHPVHSSSVAAQHHLISLLTHPLLAAEETASHPAGSSCTKSAVERYQKAFFQGNININLLQSCVHEYYIGLGKNESVSQHERLGPRLVTWLQSATKEMKEAFFSTQPFFGRVLGIMVADREERAVWTWLRMVYERDFGMHDSSESDLSSPKWLEVEDSLVSTLMRFSILRKDLDDATLQFVQACKYRQQSGRVNAEQGAKALESTSVAMTSSWKRLAVSIILRRNTHGISSEHYDAALGYATPWTLSPIFSEPVLAIYHPTTPSAQLFCMNLRQPVFHRSFLKTVQNFKKNMQLASLVTILDGAQLSLKQNLTSDAKFLLDFASENYGEYVTLSQKEQNMASEQRIESIWQKLELFEMRSGQLGFT